MISNIQLVHITGGLGTVIVLLALGAGLFLLYRKLKRRNRHRSPWAPGMPYTYGPAPTSLAPPSYPWLGHSAEDPLSRIQSIGPLLQLLEAGISQRRGLTGAAPAPEVHRQGGGQPQGPTTVTARGTTTTRQAIPIPSGITRRSVLDPDCLGTTMAMPTLSPFNATHLRMMPEMDEAVEAAILDQALTSTKATVAKLAASRMVKG